MLDITSIDRFCVHPRILRQQLELILEIMARIKPQALLQQSKKKKGPRRISVTTVVLYILIIAVLFFVFATYRHWTHRFV